MNIQSFLFFQIIQTTRKSMKKVYDDILAHLFIKHLKNKRHVHHKFYLSLKDI
ncbi:hypothetical protein PAP_05970 [Palaeococcus pacificus DY20341]|uniref:Uncharacterized protein n=1 Tax=Palaeococcus pacificus DY20341 TaxID=1343739 RepID=A0A075LTG3_9EURY|nr:hypothetical protein PAP_05970 [Palaeococcus pacificus DY20341]